MKLTQRVLHRTAPVMEFDHPWQNQQLAEQMMRFMKQQRGIGLAANQIGDRRRLFVMDVDGWVRWCFNPEIIDSGEICEQYAEGCLSFPDKQCIITRPDRIDVRYQDAQGRSHSERYTGLISRCFQHELDHLNGITMWQRYEEQHAKPS